jgi:hypothetical protein
MLLQRTNDLTFSQTTRKLFPALNVVRMLNRTLLARLERQIGPEEEGYNAGRRTALPRVYVSMWHGRVAPGPAA